LTPTDDSSKYDWVSTGSGPRCATKVLAVFSADAKDFVDAATGGLTGVVLERTNCYAESGGQLYDVGRIEGPSGGFDFANVQKYGPYVLHIGTGAAKVGDSVEVVIDFAKRALTAKNHTTTHVLNYALRSVLGGKVDQRGSLVNPEKLRFDFTNSGPVKPDQCAKVEEIVRAQIAAGYQIYTQEVALAAAREICSLRAVFGETYPDPVRVVSVGAPIDKMIADPKNEEWNQYSVEFCGGTHLQNTREADAFCIIEETATQKGVRRVECRTGALARACIANADEFEAIVRKTDAAAKDLGDRCALLLGELEKRMKEPGLPVARIEQVRDEINVLKKKAIEAEKEALAAKGNQIGDAASALARQAKAEGKTFVVTSIDAEGEVKVMEKAFEAFAKEYNTIPVFMVTTNLATKKLAAKAVVPKDLTSKLSANDWLSEALKVCGGKGGGKPENAQGQAAEPEKLAEVLEAASKLAQLKLA